MLDGGTPPSRPAGQPASYYYLKKKNDAENLFKRICALSSENIITGEIIEEYIDKEKDLKNIEVKDEKKESKFGYQSFNTLIEGFLDNNIAQNLHYNNL